MTPPMEGARLGPQMTCNHGGYETMPAQDSKPMGVPVNDHGGLTNHEDIEGACRLLMQQRDPPGLCDIL